MNKAFELDNYYTEYSTFISEAPVENKIWVLGGKIKSRYTNPLGTSEHYIDFNKAEFIHISYRGDPRGKRVVEEIDLVKMNIDLIKKESLWGVYNLPDVLEYMIIKTSGEEDFNGTRCVYLEMEDDFDIETWEIYIHKEYGVVMKLERYSESGELLESFTRTLFETGIVTDKEFEIPAGIEIEEEIY